MNQSLLPTSCRLDSWKWLHPIAWIWFFSYIGVAIRIGLSELSSVMENSQQKETILTNMGIGYFLPNIVGCFIMGACQPLKTRYKEYGDVWIGISTGFCGCCTTFATWEYQTAYQYLTNLQVNATFHFLVQLLCCFGAHRCGMYIASEQVTDIQHAVDIIIQHAHRSKDDGDVWREVISLLEPVALSSNSENLSTPTAQTYLPQASVICSAASLLLLTIASILHQPTWSTIWIGPFGAILRFELGNRLNSSTLPFGTLTANLLATAIDCFLLLWLHEPIWIKSALITGFCGSLSTVSSWINELNGFPFMKCLKYIAITHISAQFISLILLGTIVQVSSIDL